MASIQAVYLSSPHFAKDIPGNAGIVRNIGKTFCPRGPILPALSRDLPEAASNEGPAGYRPLAGLSHPDRQAASL
jgi:hypothetical protein